MATGYNQSYYDLGLICMKGHWINGRGRDYPAHNADYCHQCGSSVIHECPSCHKSIRGDYVVPGVVNLKSRKDVPAFCAQCGQAYPWTESRIAEARELIDLVESLSQSEKDVAKADVPDLAQDGPRTRVAATRVKRLLDVAGSQATTALRELFVQVASETAKKILFPGS